MSVGEVIALRYRSRGEYRISGDAHVLVECIGGVWMGSNPPDQWFELHPTRRQPQESGIASGGTYLEYDMVKKRWQLGDSARVRLSMSAGKRKMHRMRQRRKFESVIAT